MMINVSKHKRIVLSAIILIIVFSTTFATFAHASDQLETNPNNDAPIINVLNPEELTTGYVTTSGVINTVSTLSYTKRIPVNCGDTFAMWHFSSGATNTAFRFVTAYDENGRAIAALGSESQKNYTVPDGVASVVFTISNGSIDQSMILKNYDQVPDRHIEFNSNISTLDIPKGEHLINLFDLQSVSSGYMDPTGSISSTDTLCYTAGITAQAGDVFYLWNGASPYSARFITAFDASGKVVSEKGSSSPGAVYTVPEGITEVVFTVYTNITGNLMLFKNDATVPPVYIPYNEKSSEPATPHFVNFFNPEAVSSGYMAPGGAVSSVSTLCYSEKIPVNPSDVLSFWKGNLAYSPRFITAFDASGSPLALLGTNSPQSTYTVPNNVKYIVVTVYTSALDTFMLFKNNSDAPTEYVPYDEKFIPPLTPEFPDEPEYDESKYMIVTGDMKSNTKLSLGRADVITDKAIYFTANVASFQGLRLGHGYHDYTANYIEIDTASIRQYFYANGEYLQKEVSHGLKISDDIKVTIKVNTRRVATITLESGGQQFTFSTSSVWYGSNGEIFAESLGSALHDANLSFTCNGYYDAIQFYGDSYLSQSSDRWLHFAFNNGYSNALFDGYGGRGSSGAYSSLVENLKHSNPKTVVWLMGMNDGSDSNSNVPSSAWVSARDKLIALSEQKGFEIVFATIPTVPNINHEAKNKWIRESGYRYIDIAAAVGADSTGNWTEGMLSTDLIHPTENGALAIYKQVIQDLPEFVENAHCFTEDNVCSGCGARLGDISGNGKATAVDLALLNAYVKGKIRLSSAKLSIADFNRDGNVDEIDIVAIMNDCLAG